MKKIIPIPNAPLSNAPILKLQPKPVSLSIADIKALFDYCLQKKEYLQAQLDGRTILVMQKMSIKGEITRLDKQAHQLSGEIDKQLSSLKFKDPTPLKKNNK